MIKLLTIGVIAALAGTDVAAYTIYRCETDRGVIFSENHCGEGAVKLSAKYPERPRFEPADDSQILLPTLGPEAFERLSSATTEQILRQAGQPAVRYTDAGVEHWLYPSVTRNAGDHVRSPDINVENGQSYQIEWLLQPVMKRTVVIAADIADWQPDLPVKDKGFSLEDVELAGKSKDDVVQTLGEPDAKTINDGRERWEYERVKLSPDGGPTVTLLLDFDGDSVAGYGSI